MTLTKTVISWNGLDLGFGSRWLIDDPGIQGWEESTPIEKLSESRADSYGDRDTPLRPKGRTVTVAGHVNVGTDRDELVAAFLQAFTLPLDPRTKGDLIINTAGRTLTAYAQVAGRKIVQGNRWGVGRFGWAAQWVCDDYLRYGAEQSAEAPLVVTTGGITPPLTPPIVLAARPKSGVVQVYNPGSRLTPVVFELLGPQTGAVGIEQMTTGQRLLYNAPLAAGVGANLPDRLVIDTKAGTATLNGDAFRSPLAGSAITRTVGLLPGLNTIRATGTPPGTGTPKLTVRFRPASE